VAEQAYLHKVKEIESDYDCPLIEGEKERVY